jgi:branched-chain amino acid transport system ATP-binding protein
MDETPGLSRHATTAAEATALLTVRDLHAAFGESHVLHGLSFELQEGEILALLGPRGAGKSTTLRALSRMGTPVVTQGEIWLDRQPLHGMSADEAARAGIALLPGDRPIIPGLTVEENIGLAQIMPSADWPTDRICALFPRLGQRRTEEGTTLSGGERQMLAIARALAGGSKLLLLDDPCAGLSPLMVQEIARALRHIGEAGISCILAGIDATVAPGLADRTIVLDSGRIVRNGTSDEAIASPEVREGDMAL